MAGNCGKRSQIRAPGELLEELCRELLWLADRDPQECETTLLVHPGALTDFAEFNEFLGDCADRQVEFVSLVGS